MIFKEILSPLIAISALVITLWRWFVERERDWQERFILAYKEFWNADEHSDVRAWIVLEREYPELKAILEKRLTQYDVVDLDRDEYSKLEQLDKFLSIFARIRQSNWHYNKPVRRSIHEMLIRGYWYEAIEKRLEIVKYVDKCWPALRGHWNVKDEQT